MGNEKLFQAKNENGESCSGSYQHLSNLLQALLERKSQNQGYVFTIVEGDVAVAEFKILTPPRPIRVGDVYLCKHAQMQTLYRKVIEVDEQRQKAKWVMCDEQGSILTHSTVYEVTMLIIRSTQLVKEG